jgi:hypothetical protein
MFLFSVLFEVLDLVTAESERGRGANAIIINSVNFAQSVSCPAQALYFKKNKGQWGS